MTESYSRYETIYRGDRIFSIPFPYLKEEDISVYINAVITKEWEWLNTSQIMITAPLIQNDDILIQRNTPIDEKIVTYKNMSMVLNDENLNKSQDQLLYSVQEMYDKTIKSVEATDEIVKAMETVTEITNTTVKKAEQHAQNAADYASLAQEYAENVEYGVRWTPFSIANWQAEGDTYIMPFSEMSLVVLDVYKIIGDSKEKVTNVDVKVTNNKVVLISPEAFDGGILTASKIIGNYIHEQTVATNEWLINHNLGKYPTVTAVDNNGYVQIGTIQYLSLNEIRIIFENEVSGYVYLN